MNCNHCFQDWNNLNSFTDVAGIIHTNSSCFVQANMYLNGFKKLIGKHYGITFTIDPKRIPDAHKRKAYIIRLLERFKKTKWVTKSKTAIACLEHLDDHNPHLHACIRIGCYAHISKLRDLNKGMGTDIAKLATGLDVIKFSHYINKKDPKDPTKQTFNLKL